MPLKNNFLKIKKIIKFLNCRISDGCMFCFEIIIKKMKIGFYL